MVEPLHIPVRDRESRRLKLSRLTVHRKIDDAILHLTLPATDPAVIGAAAIGRWYGRTAHFAALSPDDRPLNCEQWLREHWCLHPKVSP